MLLGRADGVTDWEAALPREDGPSLLAGWVGSVRVAQRPLRGAWTFRGRLRLGSKFGGSCGVHWYGGSDYAKRYEASVSLDTLVLRPWYLTDAIKRAIL